jgi:para-aminobenzoate synthetase component 1
MSRLTEISYRPDSTSRFSALARRPWALFLDSTQDIEGSRRGRYDILAADPYLTLATRGAVTEIRDRDGLSLSTEDPFELLRRSLGDPSETVAGLPFCGGAMGWLSYDLGRRIERLPSLAQDDEGIPEMAMGLYDWALVVDHLQARAWLVSAGRDPRTARDWHDLIEMLEHPPAAPQTDDFEVTGPIRANMTRAQYIRAIERIKSYIREGDCYQVNLAQRFAATATGDPWAAYLKLRSLNPAPFSAYLSTPFAQVLSSSPERFLELRDRRVETRPIKGTRPRGSSLEADAVLARRLVESPKDRAENLMIVDLLRNDLGRVCRPGSIQVPRLFDVERYATVQHLVSTVTGELATGKDASALLRACFPGGSITGAPKIRAMEIIEELEPHRRGVYCGAIGYLGFDGSMDTSIAIRTLVKSAETIRFWAGGGIVHDSVAEEEYQETFDKAAPLLQLLEEDRLGHRVP